MTHLERRRAERRQTVRKSILQALELLDPSEEACVYLKDAIDLINLAPSISAGTAWSPDLPCRIIPDTQ